MKTSYRYSLVIVLLVILGVFGYFQIPPSGVNSKSGTAQTVAELREQIPFHEILHDLPEIGPFHWKGPNTPNNPEETISDDYTIWGKASDPVVLLKWIRQEDVKKDLNPEETNPIGGFVTTGFGIEIYSDGSYEIGEYRFFGSGYLD
ncbi:MAG: hypothetical protein R3C11_22575 [Planctomycetaceae bacterium]